MSKLRQERKDIEHEHFEKYPHGASMLNNMVVRRHEFGVDIEHYGNVIIQNMSPKDACNLLVLLDDLLARGGLS